MRYRRTFLFIWVLVLLSCAPSTPYEIAATPAMISLCEPSGAPFSSVVNLAQDHCRRYGGNAVLLQESETRCSFGAMTVMGWVTHFRCVAQ